MEAAGPSFVQSRPVTRARQMRRRSIWTGKGLFLVPALLYLAALTFFPMTELVRMSLSHVTPEVLYKPWPFVGLSEFNRAVSTADFREALFNTIVYVTVVLISVPSELTNASATRANSSTQACLAAVGPMLIVCAAVAEVKSAYVNSTICVAPTCPCVSQGIG